MKVKRIHYLIKVAAEAAVGTREGLAIYGEDYDTPNGTGIRDYIHVTDLGAAHVVALSHLLRNQGNLTLNCGYGRGYSVREVLDAVAVEAGQPLRIASAPRRAGDPPALVADARRIRAQIGWQPRYDDLAVIVRTAVAWERRLATARSDAPPTYAP